MERETLHVIDDQARVAIIDTPTIDTSSPPSGEVQLLRYQFSNHLGTAALELDDSAAIISYEEYYPYGNTSFQSGRTTAEVSLKRYRYVGKERDEETGLYYIGARYYCPWLARWCAADPINNEWYNHTHEESQRNLERQFLALTAASYEYCYASPVRFIDPTGEQAPGFDFGRAFRPWDDAKFAVPPAVKLITASKSKPAGPKDPPVIIGTTYGDNTAVSDTQKIATLEARSAEKTTGYSPDLLMKMMGKEGVSLQMYDVDQGKKTIGTVKGHGGNATIGFGHLIHLGAIGSAQYDKNAISKESEFKDGISLDKAFDLYIGDVKTAANAVEKALNKAGVKIDDLSAKFALVDIAYNQPGSLAKAVKAYAKGGATELSAEIKSGKIKSVTTDRRDLRISLLTDALKQEQIQKAEAAKKAADATKLK